MKRKAGDEADEASKIRRTCQTRNGIIGLGVVKNQNGMEGLTSG